jgi:predicted O-linked N-acetylglucosamine transferase (SPINDLY family)
MATIPEALHLALQHHQAGRLQEAEALYRQILQVEPNHPDALHLLGVIAQQAGRHDVAVDYIGRAIGLNPTVAEYHNNIGEAYRAQGKLEAAAAHYRQALALKPTYAEPFNNLGIVFSLQGKLEEAVGQYRQALALAPANAETHYNLGNALKALDRLEEAVAHFQQAVTLKPIFAEAHCNLGWTLQEQGRLGEAVASYLQALALKPGYAVACNNLGNALKAQGQLAEATAQFRQAVAFEPAFAEAYNNLGLALQEQGKFEEASAAYRQALALKPAYAQAETHLMHLSQQLCEWSNLDDLFDRQLQLVSAQPSARISPFIILSIPSSPAQQLACARSWVVNHLAPIARLRDGLGFSFTRRSKRRLRIGYLSADFRQHPVACLIAELFELHDRRSFEVLGYSYGPDDGSELRKRLARACDRFVDITAASYADAARRIHADGIDILVDLMGYTKAARTEIVALRPAPVQVNYLGYPGTMGADFIDYIITDRFITPPGQEPFFSEQFACLPDCYQINDRRRAVAESIPARKECGLPENGLVLCGFHNPFKITPRLFDVWMRVLREIPGSVLWLRRPGREAVANLHREAKVRRVDPERLVFQPSVSFGQYMAHLRMADLFLDTVPYNAQTTASDALWAGLPVLTCAGEPFASRVAGSLLTAIGLPELITYSLPEYEARALHLARNPAELAGLRERLAKNRLTAPLFDSKRYTRHLEKAYRLMWENYASGKAPMRIEVPELTSIRK